MRNLIVLMKSSYDADLSRLKDAAVAEGASACGRDATFSIGIAVCNKQAMDFGTMFSYADKALYQAKETGRNRVDILEI